MPKVELSKEDQDLLARIEKLGSRLKTARAEEEDVRAELYPLLTKANKERRISLAKLQVKTGLTRGRIHQIVTVQKQPA